MRSGPEPARELPLGKLLRQLVDRGTALGEAQLDMARAEFAQDIGVQLRRLGVFAAAALLIAFGLQFLVVSMVLVLATKLGGWLASLVVSVSCLILGAAVLAVARSRAGAPFLEKTLEALREDLRWFRALLR
jgi:hypothetical protein